MFALLAVAAGGKPVVLVRVTGSPRLEKEVATATGGMIDPSGSAKGDLVVSGTAKKEGASWRLKLQVKDAHGNVVSRATYQLKKQKLDDEVVAELKQDLGDLVAAATPKPDPVPAPAPVRVPDPEPTTPAIAMAPEPPQRPAWRTMVDVDGGLAMTGRSYSSSNPAEPKYSTSPMPGLRLDAAVYPLAARGRRWAAIGADVHYERQVGFDSGNAVMKASTTMDELGFGLRARWMLREDDRSPQLIARLGGGQRRFGTDADLGIPAVAYKYLELGLGGRLPIRTPRFAALASLAYRPVFDAGHINDMQSFGPGSASGLALEGGLEWLPFEKLSLRAGIDYSRYSLSFSGGAAHSATDASDAYLGGYLLAGYSY